MYFVHPQIHPVKCRSAASSPCKQGWIFNGVKLNYPWRIVSLLFRKPDIEELTQKLSFRFPEKQFIFTDMGRTAFRLIIENLNLRNSEILFPAYICDIFYPILRQYNIKPVFLDIDLKTFNINPAQIRQKITPSTKAILVCHTYGLPVDIKQIREILVSNNLNIAIIEDCAHSFGAKKNGAYAGNLGDVSFFSLYKQFPALRGGLLVCPKDWKIDLPKTGFNFRDFISFLNCFWPCAFLFKTFGSEIAPKWIRTEKFSEPAGINRVSLNLFSEFSNNFETSLESRKNLALIFQKELISLGFEVQESLNNVFCYLSALVPKNLVEKRDEIVESLRRYGIFCTRIWHTPIILNPEVQREYKINLNDYPNAVEAAKRIINFPLQNYYTEDDVKKIILAIQKVISRL